MWFECHTSGKTKPCLAEITDGELECPMCASLKPTEQIGYLPLYRELDGKPVCVLVHENVRDVVDSHRFLARVMVGRGPDMTDGVYVVRPTTKGTPYSSTLEERQKPADIWPTLVKLWKIPALIEWDARQTAAKSGGVIHPVEEPGIKPYTAPHPTGSVDTDSAAPLAGALAAALRRVKAAEERADDQTAIERLKLRQEE